MKRSKWSTEKINSILKESKADISVSESCRKYGMSDPTFYNWRKRYEEMEVSEAKRPRDLEEAN